MDSIDHGQSSAKPESAGGYFKMFPIPGTRFKNSALLNIVDAIHKNKVTQLPSGPVKVPSGLTYLGQFIDHDITSMQRVSEIPTSGPVPAADLIQQRSPSLDLDSLYGDGLQDAMVRFGDDGKFISEHTDDAGLIYDLPRNYGPNKLLARIVEPRNDENFIVAQMHVLFMNLHNHIIDLYQQSGVSHVQQRFDLAKRELTLLYQLVVVNEFLRTFLDEDVFNYLFQDPNLTTNAKPRIIDTLSGEDARIPVEFAGAAFRFGHALVRDTYKLNDSETFHHSLRTLFFLTGRGGLNGNQNLKEKRIDWKFFFKTSGEEPFNTFTIRPVLSSGLRNLINEMQGNQDLLVRNIMRGKELDLPSAQDIIAYINEHHKEYVNKLLPGPNPEKLSPIPEEQLKEHGLWQTLNDSGLTRKIPLWIYILMEPAFNDSDNMRLGKLGSIIIGETFRSLLDSSHCSIYGTNTDINALKAVQAHLGGNADWNSLQQQTEMSMAKLIGML